ncbi:MAG: hypothetical protein AABX64_01505 [Nanoarchaeota archaeon]
MKWEPEEERAYKLVLSYERKEGWFEFAVDLREKTYLLWHMEKSDPWYDASCFMSYTEKGVFTAGHQDRIKFALGLKDILLNAEGLGEKEKEGLALLIEEIEKKIP